MAGKLYKGDIQEILVRETGMTDTEASEAVRQFFGHIISALETDRYVKVKNLGTFKLIDVEARQSVDVTTGGRIEIPEHKKVSFVADSALKDLINKPFSHFETVELKEGVSLSEEEEVPVVEEGTADKGEETIGKETIGEETADEETAGEEEDVVDEELAINEELIVAENQTGEEEQLVMEEQLAEEEQQAEEESDKEEENVMEKEQETVDIDIEREEEQTEQVKRATLISRREELRELERQMALEEGKNKWSLAIIIILMAIFVLAGLLFLFAPEFLEKLFF